MTIAGYKFVWEAQLPNLSERIKENFYAQATAVANAKTELAITEAALVAKGYVVGLLDAEAVNETGASILGGALEHIETEAKARLPGKTH